MRTFAREEFGQDPPGYTHHTMKIAMVAERATVQVVELSAALMHKDHLVPLFTADNECLGPFAQSLYASWAVDPPDVVHAHGWMAGIASQLATEHLGVPVVQTFDGPRTAPAEYARMEAMVTRRADWVTATCTEDVIGLMRSGRPRARISVVPHGVDTDRFTPDGPAAVKAADHRVICVGESRQNDQFDVLVSGMHAVPGAELLVVGEEVARADLPQLLRSADLVSTVDASAIGTLEAMACGVPVVAPAVGAIVDSVVDNVTGYLVPPHDPRRLSNSISALLRDSFLRRSFGAAGRDRMLARYSWDRIAKDMLLIYGRVAPEASTSRLTSHARPSG